MSAFLFIMISISVISIIGHLFIIYDINKIRKETTKLIEENKKAAYDINEKNLKIDSLIRAVRSNDALIKVHESISTINTASKDNPSRCDIIYRRT